MKIFYLKKIFQDSGEEHFVSFNVSYGYGDSEEAVTITHKGNPPDYELPKNRFEHLSIEKARILWSELKAKNYKVSSRSKMSPLTGYISDREAKFNEMHPDLSRTSYDSEYQNNDSNQDDYLDEVNDSYNYLKDGRISEENEQAGDLDNYWNQEGVFEEATDKADDYYF